MADWHPPYVPCAAAVADMLLTHKLPLLAGQFGAKYQSVTIQRNNFVFVLFFVSREWWLAS